jgi:hypothetical protein
MSHATRPLFCAVSLVSFAALLAGCPAVEPEHPEPPAPMPQAGVWGLHLAEVSGDGLCAEVAPLLQGRVVRLDVAADEDGELELGLLGVDLFGGHHDGDLWADAHLPVPYWGGWDEPVVVVDYEDVDWDEEGGDPDEAWEGESEHEGEEDEWEEEEEWGECGTPDPEPETDVERGIFVSIDGVLRHDEAFDGHLSLIVSNGYRACGVSAVIDAAFLGEDVAWEDDVRLPSLEAQPGEAGEPIEVEDDWD